jgi:15-cis-phytoene desaturase
MHSDEPASDADVLIAGGGVAGLACGAALADAGLRVLLLERDVRVGGRAASWKDATTGDDVDIGPHVLISEYRHLRALLDRCGTSHLVLWQPRPLITLHDAGRRRTMRCANWPAPLHLLPNLPRVLQAVSACDVLSNVRVAWQAAHLDHAHLLALDRVDAAQWLRRMGVTERFIGWFWVTACLSLLNVPLDRCSAGALMRLVRLMLGRSGYHFGFARRALSDLYAPGCARAIERRAGASCWARPCIASGCATAPSTPSSWTMAVCCALGAPCLRFRPLQWRGSCLPSGRRKMSYRRLPPDSFPARM